MKIINGERAEEAVLTAISRHINKFRGKDILVRIDGQDHVPSQLTDHDIEVTELSYCGYPCTSTIRFIEASKWIFVIVGPYDM